jgi:peptidoglycan/LPS O-acetylase OafA/YrhL
MGEASPAGREWALDGLRGWAALSVAAFHANWDLFGKLFPVFRSDVSAVVLNGRFAVLIFFCISGFALTIGSWRRSKLHVARQLVKRHSRLAIPVFASCLIIYFVMIFGLNANQEAMAITGAGNWVRQLDFDPNACNVAWFSLVETVFWFYQSCDYNPVLWTISFEFWGSVIVLAVSLIEGPRRPYIILAALACLCFVHEVGGALTCFALGAMFALAMRDGRLPVTSSWIAVPGIAVCLVAGSVVPLEHFSLPLFACAIVFLVLTSSGLKAFFTSPLSRFLGRISFSLYLVHWIVIVTIGAHLILWFDAAGQLNVWTALAISVAILLLSVAAATLFQPVEWFTAWVGRHIQRLVPSRPLTPSAPPVAR